MSAVFISNTRELKAQNITGRLLGGKAASEIVSKGTEAGELVAIL